MSMTYWSSWALSAKIAKRTALSHTAQPASASAEAGCRMLLTMSGCASCNSCGSGGCSKAPPTADLPTVKTLVVWDGDCTLCRRWMRRYYALSGDTLDWSPAKAAAPHLPLLSLEELNQAVHVVEPTGASVRGAEAIFTIMARIGLRRWPLRLYQYVPPVRWICDVLYRSVANHRAVANQLSTVLFGKVDVPSTLLLTRRVYLRMLGLIFLAAFISIGTQIPGLFGEQGLMPSSHLAQQAIAQDVHGWQMPGLVLWEWSLTDTPLRTAALIGGIAAGLMVIGLLPWWSALIAWLSYLVLVTFGGVFMQYQWDALLLEAGFLAVLWSPGSWRLNSTLARRPSRLVHWLIVLLLGRLIFFGGLVKLQSGDSTWADCSALAYHFWTQPLPLWTAWYADALPALVSQVACVLMFVIELGAPLLLLLPRVPRTIGATLIMLLMCGIVATGNYGFFNWLTIVLCLAMFDDALLLRLWPKAARPTIRVGIRPHTGAILRWIRTVPALLVLSLVVMALWMQTFASSGAPWIRWWQQTWAPWRLVSQYGLFARMTTTRPEITIEAMGSDGTWHPYVFRWKPGPLDQPGRWCQPHMPRLDWQMWFDALTYEQAFHNGLLSPSTARLQFTGREMLPNLLIRLATHEPSVLALLQSAPENLEGPPQALRWHLDHYRFTTAAERQRTGDWWHATRLFTSPPLTLDAP